MLFQDQRSGQWVQSYNLANIEQTSAIAEHPVRLLEASSK
jgi:hypothetical protein